ncbi:MAG TPA: shikimate dehydrogenase, partial [Kiloniellaceae bacterium]
MTRAIAPLSGKARVAGLIGWPVAHSRSPRLHGYWIAEHGIDGAYVPLAVPPDHLEAAVRGLAAAGFAGVNVTIPHKEAVLALCDRVDAGARRIGAVNLLVFGDDGIAGSNTDS